MNNPPDALYSRRMGWSPIVKLCGLPKAGATCECTKSPNWKSHSPCAHEPRIAEFIPPQRRHLQEHGNNLNDFKNITLKRHECRAPFTRFLGSPHIKNSQGLIALALVKSDMLDCSRGVGCNLKAATAWTPLPHSKTWRRFNG